MGIADDADAVPFEADVLYGGMDESIPVIFKSRSQYNPPPPVSNWC